MKFNLPGTVGQHGRATGKERKWKIFWSYFPVSLSNPFNFGSHAYSYRTGV
jgi:hypothetical protein